MEAPRSSCEVCVTLGRPGVPAVRAVDLGDREPLVICQSSACLAWAARAHQSGSLPAPDADHPADTFACRSCGEGPIPCDAVPEVELHAGLCSRCWSGVAWAMSGRVGAGL